MRGYKNLWLVRGKDRWQIWAMDVKTNEVFCGTPVPNALDWIWRPIHKGDIIEWERDA